MSISAGALYVRKYFNADAKTAIKRLAQIIHKEFIKSLKTRTWMDDRSRIEALKKANAIHFHIAYPNELVDGNKLEEYYHGLELSPDSLLFSVMRIRRFINDHEMSKLRKPVNATDWETHSIPTTVDAFYAMFENSIRMFCFSFLIFKQKSYTL